VIYLIISDHAAVVSHLNSKEPRHNIEVKCYRKRKATDIEALRADLVCTDLCRKNFTDLEELTSCYNSTLSSPLDKLAPLLTKTVVNRKHVPWFDKDMKETIRARQKAERKWHSSKTLWDLSSFKSTRNHLNYIVGIIPTTSTRIVWISESYSRPPKLFS